MTDDAMSPELPDAIGDAAELAPWIRTAIRAYGKLREWRVRLFLRSVQLADGAVPAEKRVQFRDYVASKEGQDILAEYCDAVLRTASPTAITALGILYADRAHHYPESFKRVACVSVEGLPERVVDAFLELALIPGQVASQHPSQAEPYPVCSFGPESQFVSEKLRAELSTHELAISTVDELIRRQLLLPDHTTGRVGGAGINFGAGETSARFHELLSAARTARASLGLGDLVP